MEVSLINLSIISFVISSLSNTVLSKSYFPSPGKNGTDVLEEEIMNGESLSNTTLAFGLGNYYFINGDKVKAQELFNNIIKGNQWSAFGYIVAESRLK